MSMNQYMHPRNIYKTPPNFKQLALEFPEFRKYVNQDVTGKITFDFKNVEALRALSCTLLKKDFNIDLEIPLNKLIPTIPLRLNYILWVEDLLNLVERTGHVKGIDIGTGASCVYPLIAAKKNRWYMIATEIDSESIDYATRNVQRNNLTDLINVIHIKGNMLIEEVIDTLPEEYDFCMCNPPFFGNMQELFPSHNSRKFDRPRPKNAFCASTNEVVSKGGEVDYVSKLINESKNVTTKIKIYTTMIGHKSSLPPLKKLLRDVNVVSFKQTEFCQGNTTRWGLAWTYLDIDLRKIPSSLIADKQKLPKPLLHEIPKIDETSYKMTVISQRLIQIFKDLQIEYQEVKHVKDLIEFIIVAYSNTWSHQRKKRREQLRLNKSSSSESSNCDSTGVEISKTCDKLAEMGFNGTANSKKRSFEDDSGYYSPKRMRTGLEECNINKIHLKATISIISVNSVIGLELVFIEGNGTKEALHQILQYIKNNLYEK